MRSLWGRPRRTRPGWSVFSAQAMLSRPQIPGLRIGEGVDVSRFYTPSPQASGRNGPYMLNGLFPSALDAVHIYNAAEPGRKRNRLTDRSRCPLPSSPSSCRRSISRSKSAAISSHFRKRSDPTGQWTRLALSGCKPNPQFPQVQSVERQRCNFLPPDLDAGPIMAGWRMLGSATSS